MSTAPVQYSHRFSGLHQDARTTMRCACSGGWPGNIVVSEGRFSHRLPSSLIVTPFQYCWYLLPNFRMRLFTVLAHRPEWSERELFLNQSWPSSRSCYGIRSLPRYPSHLRSSRPAPCCGNVHRRRCVPCQPSPGPRQPASQVANSTGGV